MGYNGFLIRQILFLFMSCLMATIIIELAVAAFLFQVKDARRLALVALAQVATNPLAVYVSLLVISFTRDLFLYCGAVALLELAVIAAESFLYRATKRFDHPAILSLVSNLCSFAAGIVWQVVSNL